MGQGVGVGAEAFLFLLNHVAVDTGTSQLAGPSDIIMELQNKLDVQQKYAEFVEGVPR